MVWKGVQVAITFLRQYYVGCGVIIQISNRDPLLILVSVLEESDAIKIPIQHPVHEIQKISQCKDRDIVWKAQYVNPDLEVDESNSNGINDQLIKAI